MKRRILCFVLTMAMVLSMLVVVPAVTVSADTWSTSGTTHTISTANDLMSFASAVTASEHFSGHTIVLANDIDMSGKVWQGVGYSGGNDAYFSGTFDGQGHSITNITANTGNADYLGSFFRILRDGALVKDVALYGTVTLTRTSSGNSDYFGSVAAGVIGTATIQNVYSAVNFDASHFEDVSATNCGLRNVGGLVGFMFNTNAGFLTIDSCVYAGTITCNATGSGSNRPYAFGGLVGALGSPGTGEHKLYIKSSAFLGEISVKSMNHCGAFIGSVYDPSSTSGMNLVWIDDCYAGGTVSVLPHASPRAKYNGYLVGAFGYYLKNGNDSSLTTSQCTNRIYFQNCYYVSANYTRNENTENTFDQLSGNAQITASQNRTATDRATYNSYSPSTTQEGNSGGPYFNVNDISIANLCNMTAGTTNFADASAWHFFTGSTKALPVPASIYNSFGITPEQEISASIFDDMTQSEFEITTSAQMAEFADLVNAGTTFEGKTIKLGADVALNTTVGYTGSSDSDRKPFMGSFDGQGHTVTISQTLSNPDGNGGLFSMVRVPADSSITIQNVHLAGTITLTNSTTGKGYIGALISTVDAGTSGSGGTLNVTNVWSTTRINAGNANTWYALSGYIGFVRHDSGLKPITINIDSCLWDGVINAGPALEYTGAFVGYTGNQGNANRPLTLNITNSVLAGTIMLNAASTDDTGLLTGYLKGNGTNNSTSNVTANFHDIVITGKFTSSVDVTKWCSLFQHSGTTTVDLDNFYYVSFNVPGKGAIPVHEGNGTVTGEATVKTKAGIYELTTSNFTTAAKWNIASTHYPCPQGLVDTFGVPSSLETTAYDVYDEFEIGTDGAMASFASAVNSGKTYEGKTVKLTADVNLTTQIGDTDTAKYFSGNFNGQGHTVTITQTFANPDGFGGLFSMVRVPADSSITIQNVHLAGTITLTNDTTGKGYIGALISTVDAGTSGSGGTLNVTNVWSTTRINAGNSNTWYAISGFIGFVRHASGLKPLTINMDSCLWDGVINAGPALEYSGAFVGYTGNQGNANRPLTLNITNSVLAGTIMLNTASTDDTGLLTGYLKGNGNNSSTSAVTANFHDIAITGKFTSSASLTKWCSLYQLSGTTAVDMDNFYYINFTVPGKGDIPVYEGTATPTGEATVKTAIEMYAMTTSAFSNAAKWNKTDGYIACPAGIVSTFGEVPDTLYVEEYDRSDTFSISTTAAFLAFRDSVNAGKNYSGKTVQLTADIDLIGVEWVGIGSRNDSKVFSGTFDGQGHTISNLTVAAATSETGALFGQAGNATIQDFTLTGTITTSGDVNFMGSVVNCIYGTSTLRNVRSQVNFTPAANGQQFFYCGGLIGFIHNTQNANLTIDGCEYAGNINTGGQTNSVAGILGYTGWGNAGVTKTITIENTGFTGSINFNDPSYYHNNGGFIGYVCRATDGGTITVNISDSYTAGRLYFKRSVAWARDNSDQCGQIIGCVDSGVTLNIAATVTYVPAYLYTALPISSETKVVLGEIGKFGDDYSVDTDAIIGGMEAIAVAYDETDGTGIRFTASFFNKASCTGGGSSSANFGIFLMTKLVYDELGGEDASYSAMNALVGTGAVYKIYAAKYRNEGGAYTVNVVVMNLNETSEMAGELVAIPYAGSTLGNAVVASYNELFAD